MKAVMALVRAGPPIAIGLGGFVRRQGQGLCGFDQDDVAVDVNSKLENIGARRLQTVIERVLDEISFSAPDRSGEKLVIDGKYVRGKVEDLAKNADISRFIL